MHDASAPDACRTSRTELAGPDVHLRRRPERGSHACADVYAIIDAAPICHVAFAADGQILTLPTAHARCGDQIYLHGAVKNRMLQSLCESGRASLTWTLIDGLVFARTAFHHSMNYRAAVAFGRASEVTDGAEKVRALAAVIEHMAPGRMRELSPPTASELKATRVVRVEIEQASAKVRSGGPVDAKADLERPVWAGTVPLSLVPSAPIRDPELRTEQPMSEAAQARALMRPEPSATQTWFDYEFSTDRTRLNIPWVHAFLRDESYWARGIDELTFRTSLTDALCFGAYRDGQQVAFARVVTDGVRFSYLCDVFVATELRGLGLGHAFIRFVLEHPRIKDSVRCLLGTRDAHTFYEPLGFVHAAPGRYMLRYKDDEVPR